MRAFYETRYYPTRLKVWTKRYANVHFVPHWHSEIEFIFVRKGKIQIIINGSSFTANTGDLIICDGGLVHYSTARHVNNELDFLIFDYRLIDNTFNGFQLVNPIVSKKTLIENHLYNTIFNLHDDLEKEFNKKDILYEKIICSLIQYICINLMRVTQQREKRSSLTEYEEENLLLKKVIEYIENNYTDNLRLKDVSSIMNMTESYFSTFFKMRTNYNFTDYVNMIRLENSISDIYWSTKNFTEIAFSNGFNNLRTFNRVFKKYTGKTPSQFSKESFKNNHYVVRKSYIEYHTDFSVNKTLINS
ncbi:AraC family transcriptional regulator [Globicatella sanguinis]|uniref:AraC family transcriptional regulator n=1 Tax=Globicatella sanguinis TaxID=13076 RepID=UPI002543F7DF|nr:AraC family transcriptional regulator [Globicatella sanguinis]MDK7631553.1 AraC family transcriptional regulator [Globicatella sanguinis]WIK66197.1 AraC family transcriptional regulator [Globicatella sanguinis]WKT55602.1 AraC family transcriptional regulator [Globicatella sanguinis]